MTYSWIYLRVQPFTSSFSLPAITAATETASTKPASTRSHLQFILHLADPGHNLVHTAVTQSIPAEWLEQWDQYEWIEDMVVGTLRQGVEVLGQEYLAARMSWLDKSSQNEADPAD